MITLSARDQITGATYGPSCWLPGPLQSNQTFNCNNRTSCCTLVHCLGKSLWENGEYKGSHKKTIIFLQSRDITIKMRFKPSLVSLEFRHTYFQVEDKCKNKYLFSFFEGFPNKEGVNQEDTLHCAPPGCGHDAHSQCF